MPYSLGIVRHTPRDGVRDMPQLAAIDTDILQCLVIERAKLPKNVSTAAPHDQQPQRPDDRPQASVKANSNESPRPAQMDTPIQCRTRPPAAFWLSQIS